MNKSTYIGLALGIIAVVVGMYLKGASPASLLNGATFMIIFVGTAAALFIGFEMEDLKKIPKLFKVLFSEQKLESKKDLMELFTEMTATTRREGLLALEAKVDEIQSEFMKNGLRMIIDGNDQEFVRDVLLEEVSAMEERHRNNALIFTQAGTYAPTLGVLGAVVGLIAALSNLSEVEKLGHLISAAFVATLLGIFSGYVLWHPMANKLKQKSKKEVEIKLMIVEGLLSIQAGVSVFAVTQKLSVFLSPTERAASNKAEGEQ